MSESHAHLSARPDAAFPGKVCRADDRSLTTDEVNGWVARIVATVAEFGGTLRA